MPSRLRRFARPTATALLPALLAAASGGAQVWSESGDAGNYPDGAAQQTRGAGPLTGIVGATGAGDPRDAYCIKISNPATFVATTDPAVAEGASADFNTRLLLFRSDGAAMLANDDTPPGGSTLLSTLTSNATDGSRFALTQPGEYVLVVGGLPDQPVDAAGEALFAIASDLGAIHAADVDAGRFDRWESPSPAVGSYSAILDGVEPCQNRLDAIFGRTGAANSVCEGLGTGGFFGCELIGEDANNTHGLALGYVDKDPNADVVFGNYFDPSRVCFGDGSARFAGCVDVLTELWVESVALGFLNGDQHLDAVFAVGSGAGGGSMDPSRVCLGDGVGGFSCSEIVGSMGDDRGVALGLIDGDRHVDAVFARVGVSNAVCLGDGNGGLTCSDVSSDALFSRDVALGLVDQDVHLDAVFANSGSANRLCLGDGGGGFSCSDVGGQADPSRSVALGTVNGDDSTDAVFANAGERDRLCLGDGSGAFSCSDVSTEDRETRGVAVGFVDGDSFMDAVLAIDQARNQVCFGGPDGISECIWMVGDSFLIRSVALAESGEKLILMDGFESGDTSAWSTTVP